MWSLKKLKASNQFQTCLLELRLRGTDKNTGRGVVCAGLLKRTSPSDEPSRLSSETALNTRTMAKTIMQVLNILTKQRFRLSL